MSNKIKLNRLKEILAREDKTTVWLAEKIGKSRVVVSNYVNNNTQPSLETLFQIAAALQSEGISIQPRELVAEGDARNIVLSGVPERELLAKKQSREQQKLAGKKKGVIPDDF